MGSSRTCDGVTGPLAGFEAAFRRELQDTGYAPSSVDTVTATMAQLSSWMGRNGVTAQMLTPA